MVTEEVDPRSTHPLPLSLHPKHVNSQTVMAVSLPSWRVRSGYCAQSQAWIKALTPFARSFGLTLAQLDDAPPPMPEQIATRRGGGTDPHDDRDARFGALCRQRDEWLQVNTLIFEAVKPSLIIEGSVMQAADEEAVERFQSGLLCDGRGLIRWARAFCDLDAPEVQDKLKDIILKMKLSPDADRAQFVAHCHSLLMRWRKVTGNKLEDPFPYYDQLLRSMQGIRPMSELTYCRYVLSQHINIHNTARRSKHSSSLAGMGVTVGDSTYDWSQPFEVIQALDACNAQNGLPEGKFASEHTFMLLEDPPDGAASNSNRGAAGATKAVAFALGDQRFDDRATKTNRGGAQQTQRLSSSDNDCTKCTSFLCAWSKWKREHPKEHKLAACCLCSSDSKVDIDKQFATASKGNREHVKLSRSYNKVFPSKTLKNLTMGDMRKALKEHKGSSSQGAMQMIGNLFAGEVTDGSTFDTWLASRMAGGSDGPGMWMLARADEKSSALHRAAAVLQSSYRGRVARGQLNQLRIAKVLNGAPVRHPGGPSATTRGISSSIWLMFGDEDGAHKPRRYGCVGQYKVLEVRQHLVRLEIPTDGSAPQVHEWQPIERVRATRPEETPGYHHPPVGPLGRAFLKLEAPQGYHHPQSFLSCVNCGRDDLTSSDFSAITLHVLKLNPAARGQIHCKPCLSEQRHRAQLELDRTVALELAGLSEAPEPEAVGSAACDDAARVLQMQSDEALARSLVEHPRDAGIEHGVKKVAVDYEYVPPLPSAPTTTDESGELRTALKLSNEGCKGAGTSRKKSPRELARDVCWSQQGSVETRKKSRKAAARMVIGRAVMFYVVRRRAAVVLLEAAAREIIGSAIVSYVMHRRADSEDFDASDGESEASDSSVASDDPNHARRLLKLYRVAKRPGLVVSFGCTKWVRNRAVHAAATLLQSSCRRRLACSRLDRLHCAAERLQASYRCRRERNELRERAAATLLQSALRGRAARGKVLRWRCSMLFDKVDCINRAVITIQKVARAANARKGVACFRATDHRARLRERAARVLNLDIDSVIVGYLATECACIVQRHFRAHLERKRAARPDDEVVFAPGSLDTWLEHRASSRVLLMLSAESQADGAALNGGPATTADAHIETLSESQAVLTGLANQLENTQRDVAAARAEAATLRARLADGERAQSPNPALQPTPSRADTVPSNPALRPTPSHDRSPPATKLFFSPREDSDEEAEPRDNKGKKQSVITHLIAALSLHEKQLTKVRADAKRAGQTIFGKLSVAVSAFFQLVLRLPSGYLIGGAVCTRLLAPSVLPVLKLILRTATQVLLGHVNSLSSAGVVLLTRLLNRLLASLVGANGRMIAEGGGSHGEPPTSPIQATMEAMRGAVGWIVARGRADAEPTAASPILRVLAPVNTHSAQSGAGALSASPAGARLAGTPPTVHLGAMLMLGAGGSCVQQASIPESAVLCHLSDAQREMHNVVVLLCEQQEASFQPLACEALAPLVSLMGISRPHPSTFNAISAVLAVQLKRLPSAEAATAWAGVSTFAYYKRKVQILELYRGTYAELYRLRCGGSPLPRGASTLTVQGGHALMPPLVPVQGGHASLPLMPDMDHFMDRYVESVTPERTAALAVLANQAADRDYQREFTPARAASLAELANQAADRAYRQELRHMDGLSVFARLTVLDPDHAEPRVLLTLIPREGQILPSVADSDDEMILDADDSRSDDLFPRRGHFVSRGPRQSDRNCACTGPGCSSDLCFFIGELGMRHNLTLPLDQFEYSSVSGGTGSVGSGSGEWVVDDDILNDITPEELAEFAMSLEDEQDHLGEVNPLLTDNLFMLGHYESFQPFGRCLQQVHSLTALQDVWRQRRVRRAFWRLVLHSVSSARFQLHVAVTRWVENVYKIRCLSHGVCDRWGSARTSRGVLKWMVDLLPIDGIALVRAFALWFARTRPFELACLDADEEHASGVIPDYERLYWHYQLHLQQRLSRECDKPRTAVARAYYLWHAICRKERAFEGLVRESLRDMARWAVLQHLAVWWRTTIGLVTSHPTGPMLMLMYDR